MPSVWRLQPAAAMKRRPKLLVSIHDVSPLTRTACMDIIDLLRAAGIAPSMLTCLVIPFHKGHTRLDHDSDTQSFLRGLVADGAQLVLHGYTHRMVGRPRGLVARWKAGWWARGDGEFFLCSAPETRRRLMRARAIVERAGLGALTGFVPPAWLLSPAARTAVADAGFAFYETFEGIVHGDSIRARRLVGGFASWDTTIWSQLQMRRAPRDTRLAIHPPDVATPVARRRLEAMVCRLVEKLEPVRYDAFLAEAA